MKKIFSIKNKIFLATFGLSMFFLLLIGAVINETYAKSLCTNEENYNILATDKLKSEFDYAIDSVQRTAAFLSTNSEIVAFLEEKSKSGVQDSSDSLDINLFLQNISNIEPYIDSIQVFKTNNQISSTNSALNTKDILECYKKQISKDPTSRSCWTEKHNLVGKSSKNVEEVFSYIYKISGTEQLGNEAFIVINVSYQYIEEKFIDFAIEADEKAFICNSDGKIILNYPNTTSFEPVVKQYPEILGKDDFVLNRKVFGVDNIVVSKQLNKIQWKILRVIPTDSITIQTKQMGMYLKMLLVVSAIISFFVAMFLAQMITKPINSLNVACKHVESGNLSYHLRVHGKDELSQLGHTFNLMIDQINLNMKRELEDQKQKADLQLQILQAQINPHFLYNTLDSIKWLAAMHNMNNIVEMSTALINLLKYNLSYHNALTTLEDEINSVKNYITIQKFRYLDTFELSTSLEADTLNCQVLRFVLQPLVENSIIHGFRDVEKNYSIQVVSYFLNDTLHIKVIDNGCGMNGKRVEQINFGIENDKCFNNIGVNNIRKRIQLNFGKKYGLTYRSVPNSGTIAEVTLPIKHLDKKE